MSSSLMLNALTTPPREESLQRELYQRNRELAEAQEQLRLERLKTASIEAGVSELRTVLTPLYQALQHIFGEIGAMDIAESTPPMRAHLSSAWELWQQKLPGLPAKAIGVLLAHGELNRTQLRIQLGCATRSITDVVYKLNQAGLINKNGGKISLKQL
jgi:hypothetical protein